MKPLSTAQKRALAWAHQNGGHLLGGFNILLGGRGVTVGANTLRSLERLGWGTVRLDSEGFSLFTLHGDRDVLGAIGCSEDRP